MYSIVQGTIKVYIYIYKLFLLITPIVNCAQCTLMMTTSLLEKQKKLQCVCVCVCVCVCARARVRVRVRACVRGI